MNPPIQSTHANVCRVLFDYFSAEIYFQFRSLNVCVFLSLRVSQNSREVTDEYLGFNFVIEKSQSNGLKLHLSHLCAIVSTGDQ